MAFDDSIKYIRTPIEEISREAKNPNTDKLNNLRPKYSSNWDLRDSEDLSIGFCGKIYPLIRWKGKIYYSQESISEDLKKFSEKEYKRNIKTFNNYFEVKECKEPFINQRSPIVVLGERIFGTWKTKSIWNARLKDYNFQKILDPYQAFQQIEMFLGNLAEPQMPMPKMSDDQKRDSHGFDYWSFKKK